MFSKLTSFSLGRLLEFAGKLVSVWRDVFRKTP